MVIEIIKFSKLATPLTALLVVGAPNGGQDRRPLFTEAERKAVVAYWAQPGRYRVSLPEEAQRAGKWQVRLTVEGSLWLYRYDRARGLPKLPPGSTPPPLTPMQKTWEAWIDSKIEYDRYLAGLSAQELNLAAGTASLSPEPAAPPGPIPAGLAELAGNPPAFAAAVSPMRHTIKVGDSEFGYTDNVPMRKRYAYYRNSKGVMSGGQRVREMQADQLQSLFKRAGIDESQQRVFKAVSLLEGGFDSVNTYDTGLVSVGFIQFASLKDGAGSLGRVLLTMKGASPGAFQKYFRAFGIDVQPDGFLDVVDPATGEESWGADAAKKIGEDKRLIAAFQYAGRRSDEFKVAQLMVARDQYYPSADLIPITAGGETKVYRVSDLFKSECGMATLMDRKVNTGKLDPLAALLNQIVADYGLGILDSPADIERELVAALVYRKSYLDDRGLSQPRLITGATARGTGGRLLKRPTKSPK